MVRQTARFNLRIEPDLLAALEQISEAADRSIAWVVRDALRSYVINQPQTRGATLEAVKRYVEGQRNA